MNPQFVRHVRSYLILLGHDYLTTNGDEHGPNFRRALSIYKNKAGLAPDCVIDDGLIDHFGDRVNSPLKCLKKEGHTTKELQAHLILLGFDSDGQLEADGEMGEFTIAGLKASHMESHGRWAVRPNAELAKHTG